MLRSDSRILRTIWALLALVQIGVTAVGPLADSLLEEPAERVAHVESESSEDCGTHHDHLFCQVCRTVIAGPHQASTPCVSAPLPASVDAVRAESESPRVGTILVSAHGSRAPPRA